MSKYTDKKASQLAINSFLKGRAKLAETSDYLTMRYMAGFKSAAYRNNFVLRDAARRMVKSNGVFS